MTLHKSLSFYRINYRDLLILILVFVVPFFHNFSNITLAIILLVPLIEIIRKKELPDINFFWFLPTLFLYYVISELMSGGTWTSIEKRLLLFFIPLAFALNPNFYKDHLKFKIYLSYILGNLSAVGICLVRAIIRSFVLQDGQWTFNPKVIQDTEYDFLTSSVMGGNYFFGEEFSFFHHPTYAGIYIIMAQCMIFEVLKSSPTRRGKQLLLVCYVIFLFALFLLSSKAAIICSLIISFWLLFRIQVPQYIRISTLAGFAIVAVIFLFFNPRLKVFKDTLKTDQIINPNARYGYDLRILSWDASITLIKDNWLLGVGEAKKRSALVEVYTKKGYVVPAAQSHNSHNQYLDFLVGGGLIGFGLFITGLITLSVRAVKESNFPLLAFLFIFSFNALFEDLLSRYAGVLFFSIFITLFVTKRSNLE